MVQNPQGDYIVLISIITFLIIIGWLWLAYLKIRVNRSWHSYGCIWTAISYGITAWFNHGLKIDSFDWIHLIGLYLIFLIQLSAVIAFIINSILKDKPQRN